MSAPLDRAGVVHLMTRAAIEGTSTSMHGSMVDALAALEAADLRVVPVEATFDMYERAGRSVYGRLEMDRIYSAMLAASPFAPPKETQE